MARKFLNNIDLAQNEIQNVKAQNLAAAPASPVVGQFWYNTTSGRIEFRGAAAVIDPTARANHLGTQTSSTISDLAGTVQGYRLDQFAAPNVALSVGGQRVINGATPTAAGDLCTKNYVDSLVNGVDWKQSVRAASTGNVALTGLQTIDGVSLIANDRVLLKNQTTASQNGIWLVQAGAWTRAPDADVGTLTSGAATMVTEGTVNGDQQWRLQTDDPISVGTTALTFAQIGQTVAYTGTGGVNVAGNVVSLDTAVAVRKFSQTFGDGAALSYVISHALGTLDVTVGVYQLSDGAEIECDVLHTSTNAVTLLFAVAPALNALRVVTHG